MPGNETTVHVCCMLAHNVHSVLPFALNDDGYGCENVVGPPSMSMMLRFCLVCCASECCAVQHVRLLIWMDWISIDIADFVGLCTAFAKEISTGVREKRAEKI